MKQEILKSYNINSAIIFYAFGCLIFLCFGVETNIKNLFMLLCFTILFWLVNSLQAYKDRNKDK